MKMTSRPFTLEFKDFGEITVPAGTKVTHMTACGLDENYNFVDQFDWIVRDYPTVARILEMDARNYGINIPAEFVTEVDNEAFR